MRYKFLPYEGFHFISSRLTDLPGVLQFITGRKKDVLCA
jgi:hypothetical protein